MELSVVVPGQTENNKLAVSETVFDRRFNEGLVHQVITAHSAGLRAGTKAQKGRGEVSGGGRKPWRQKGTGRARFGSIRVPSWRKGGVVFAAKPRDHSQKINRKMYREALRSIFSELIRQERFMVVDNLVVEEAKTKLMQEQLKKIGVTKALIILPSFNEKLYLAAKNLPFVAVIEVSEIDPVSLIRFDKIIMSPEAIKKVEEWLG